MQMADLVEMFQALCAPLQACGEQSAASASYS